MTQPSDRRPAALLLAEEVWGSTLHAMRSLAGRGAEVLVAVAGDGASIYRSSTVCNAAVDLPTEDARRFCELARDWAASTLEDDRPVVVIPLSDRLADYANQNREVFPGKFRLALSDPDMVESLLDKRISLAIAEKAGLSVPAWEAIGAGGAASYPVAPGAPVAVRPARWTDPGPGYFKIAVTHEQEAVDRLAADSTIAGVPLIVQQYIDTDDDAVEFGIVWRSRDRSSTAVCTGRKRRQSAPGGGVMVWGEAVELPEVVEATTNFLDESGFTGLGGIEFIRDGDRLWFIEFNPRLEAIHFLATAAGVDTVAMAYEEFAGGGTPVHQPRQHEAGAWLGAGWLERMRTDPAYRWRTVADRWAFSRLPVRARAIWSWQDPRPGVRVFARLVGRATRSAKRDLQNRRGSP